MLSPNRRVLGGVTLVCFANLLLEVVLTRIFSTTMYYHFTFLSIALALLGMGAAGVYVYIRADRFPPERVHEDLARYARLFCAFTVLALAYVLANPIEIIQGKLDPLASAARSPAFTERTYLQLVLLNGFAALPFFFAGLVVSLAIFHYRRHVDKVYSFDLFGAATAALLVGALLGVFGGPDLVLVVALCAAAAALLFDSRPSRNLGVLGAVALLLLVNHAAGILRIPTIKGTISERVLFEKWNAFSRVTVEKMASGHDIRIDASAATSIKSTRDIGAHAWVKDLNGLALHLKPKRALIIGPGGGPDVVNALDSGSEQVIGVEVNPIIAETIMKDRFKTVSGGLYLDPRVRIVTDEGRSYIRRSPERYDLIQATLVDTWAATAAGAFALTENTLYTLEAFEDYFDHLSDSGVVSMTRWSAGSDPEAMRLTLLAAAALETRGVPPAEARKHLYLASHGSRGTLVAKRSPFTDDEIARLDAACKAGGYTVVLSPTQAADKGLAEMVAAGSWSPRVRAHPLDLTPPTDDRPFFFYFLKPADLFNPNRFMHGGNVGDPAVWILIASGLALVGLTVAFILLPLVRHRTAALAGGGSGASLRRTIALVYFGLLGLAFITIEIALLQKLGVFLGHPSYALLVVLFSVLLSSSVGAWLSGPLCARFGGKVTLVGVLLFVLGGSYAFVLGPLLRGWIAWPLFARILLSGSLVAVMGVFMGMLLPIGVRLLSDRDAELVPWGWGLNGAMSVIGTVGATICAIHVGFSATLLVGAIIYGLAAAAGLLLTRFGSRS